MADIRPLFATAPRLKIYINQSPVAYAIGFNVSVAVDVQPVMVIGQYAPVSWEPTMYQPVSGTMQIVRLLTNTTLNANVAVATGDDFTGKNAATASYLDFNSANNPEKSGPVDGAYSTNNPLAQSELFRHIDPAQLLFSKAFDVEVFMKVPGVDGKLVEKSWMRIDSCRITSRNTNISMGSLVNEPLNFQGLLLKPTADGTDTFALDQENKQVT